MSKFHSFRDLIDRFGQHDLARAVQLKPVSVRAWHIRDSIPPAHYPRVVEAGEELGVSGVSLSELYRLASARRPKARSRAVG